MTFAFLDPRNFLLFRDYLVRWSTISEKVKIWRTFKIIKSSQKRTFMVDDLQITTWDPFFQLRLNVA